MRIRSAGLEDALEEVRANHSLWIMVLGVCLRDQNCFNNCNKLQWQRAKSLILQLNCFWSPILSKGDNNNYNAQHQS